MSKPIVVGVDAERASGDALFWSLAEARRRHTWVLMLHVADRADEEAAAASGITVSMRAAGVLRAHRRVAARLAPDVRILGQAAGGAAAEVLAEATRRAELLVIGSRGRAGIAESALGSVSHRVVAHAHCPVVIVPQGSSRLVARRIAVGVADRSAGQPVLDFAAAQARRWGATLCLVHAQGEAQGESAEAELSAAAAYVRRHHADVVVERAASPDSAVAALVAEAARSDLLVLGCRHTEEQFGCRVGAVPAGVLPQVSCPVALVGRVPLAAAA
jgi:nucleotide-binding universal stress UspA family protein